MASLFTYHSVMGFPIEEQNFTIVPSPVRVFNSRQYEAGEAIVTLRRNFVNPALIFCRCMLWIIVVPYVKRDFSILKIKKNQIKVDFHAL